MRLSKKQKLLLVSLLASSKLKHVKGFRGQEATIPELYVKESYPINSSPNILSMYLNNNNNNNKQLNLNSKKSKPNLYSKKSQLNKQLFNQILEYRRSQQNKNQKKNRRSTKQKQKQKQKAFYKNPSVKSKRTSERYGNTLHFQRRQQKQKGRRRRK